jgi:hypothetical protein
MDNFIPKAIETANKLENHREKLSWVTGSWLINRYLQTASQDKVGELEEMICKGYIGYHGLPFTTHTELMNERLFRYGLSIAQKMDKHFKRKTIAAKMTDVPGHTIAMVPLLAQNGIKFLHIGVNPGSTVPDVPPVFRWKAPDGSSVIVQYSATYGAQYKIPGIDDMLVIENNPDNSEPPSAEQVIATYARLEKQYPDYEVIPSSLDAYARAILPYQEQFPILEQEIGDTWIYGIATDPYKVCQFKRLLNFGERMVKADKFLESSSTYNAFYGSLLMIPEHTWGLDCKKYLPDYSNWSMDAFREARKKNKITLDMIPDKYKPIEKFTEEECKRIFSDGLDRRKHLTYSFFESSHKEQREYLTTAFQQLPKELQSCFPQDQKLKTGMLDIFDVNSDGMISLNGFRCQFSYQTFSSADYDRYHIAYNRNFNQNWKWCCADFGKPGMEFAKPTPEHKLFYSKVSTVAMEQRMLHVHLQRRSQTPESCPLYVTIDCSMLADGKTFHIDVSWQGKQATRLPEALWFSFYTSESDYRLKKLGSIINPWNVVSKGARSLHAIEEMVGNNLSIKTLSSPLVSLGERKLLQFDNEFPQRNGEVHFNLFNNIWGTNFPQWYDQDGESKFIVEIKR